MAQLGKKGEEREVLSVPGGGWLSGSQIPIFHGRKLIDNTYNGKKSKLAALKLHLNEGNITQTQKKIWIL